MNIDERLERLVERHQALTDSVESLAATVRGTHDIARKNTETIRELMIKSSQDGEHINALARIAELHERRLTDLEGPK